jgi:hypothetical protein
MIGNWLYAIENYNASPTKICYSFNLSTENDELTDIPFKNTGSFCLNLQFNYLNK